MSRGGRADTRADTAVATLCVLLALTLLILPDPTRERVASAIRGNLVSPLATLQERGARARRAFVVNDSLRIVADSVISRSQRLDGVTAENERLRSLLRLGRAINWGYVPAEALVGRGVGEEYTLLLSAGAEQGVQPLSPVVAADGLVGMIRTVDPTTSVAIIWPHPEFRVSAVSLDGAAFGIVTAHQGDRAERYLLELHGVPARAQLRAGSPIVSSGLGGIFPRGILVGTVIRDLRTGSGWARTYLVQPAVRPADLTSVMILSPQRSGEGVESVWMPLAESQLRRIRAAADSLVADSLRAEVRRLDSLRLDSLRTDSIRAETLRAESLRADTGRTP